MGADAGQARDGHDGSERSRLVENQPEGVGCASGACSCPAVPYAGEPFELINDLWLLWDQRRQCLHDKAARTVVAKKGPLVAQGAPAVAGYPGGGAPYPGYGVYPGYPGSPPV